MKWFQKMFKRGVIGFKIPVDVPLCYSAAATIKVDPDYCSIEGTTIYLP